MSDAPGSGPLAARGPVAAIDCGTNSTRLLIVGTDGSTLKRHMRITRLGEGVDATRALSPTPWPAPWRCCTSTGS